MSLIKMYLSLKLTEQQVILHVTGHGTKKIQRSLTILSVKILYNYSKWILVFIDSAYT